MPTYQYACTECGHRLEAVQSFSDEPLTVCTECEGKLRKVFSAVGVVFKGSGFYRTDSRASVGGSNGSPKTESTSGSKESSTPTPTPSSSGSANGSNGTPAPSGKASTPAAKAS